MKELTKAEEQVMQILWKLKKAFVKDVLAEMPEPKPAYNTVSTIVRILEKKGFVGYTAYGKTHEYFPLVERNNYSHFYLKNFLGNYFNGSFERLVSFFAKENNLDVQDVNELMKWVENDIQEPETNSQNNEEDGTASQPSA
ncbi:MAG TPA: transcriptional regulator [Cytophagales bacterium]|nr:transcriptional regulator [Cytophagales bacterium]HAA22531.1 transcriptional regulator [Cytophagales bacterium]HAP61401.1 transcriptional regulator [Cytophagales bacterium]